MLTRKLFVIGLALLILAFASLVLTAIRLFPSPARMRVSLRTLYYVVQPGETLMHVSEKLYKDRQYWDEIADYNNIKAPYTISSGQTLAIPPDAQPTPTDMPILTPSLTLVPTPRPMPTPLPTAMIHAQWPKRVESGRPYLIKVSFVRMTDQASVPPIEAGCTAIAVTPIPVGTPGASIERAFGLKYNASAAIVNLEDVTEAFHVRRRDKEDQPLEKPQIDWKWDITPKESKSDGKVVFADIKIRWESVESGEPIEERIWWGAFPISIWKPKIPMWQLMVFTLLDGFLGSMLSVPWLYERIKERREKRQKDEESKPKIYLP